MKGDSVYGVQGKEKTAEEGKKWNSGKCNERVREGDNKKTDMIKLKRYMYIFILKNTKLCVELVKNLSENGERERRCVRERERNKNYY